MAAFDRMDKSPLRAMDLRLGDPLKEDDASPSGIDDATGHCSSSLTTENPHLAEARVTG